MPDENQAVAAIDAAEPVILSRYDAFVQRGHAIIATELARAKTLATTYPVVGVLLPSIESALRGLFVHLVTDGKGAPDAGPSRDETSDTIIVDGQRVPAPHMTPEAPATAPASNDFPPIRDDKVPAVVGTEAGTAG